MQTENTWSKVCHLRDETDQAVYGNDEEIQTSERTATPNVNEHERCAIFDVNDSTYNDAATVNVFQSQGAETLAPLQIRNIIGILMTGLEIGNEENVKRTRGPLSV